MRNDWVSFRVRRSTVIVFWVVVLAILFGIYFFAPSLFNRMQQSSYQKTPYVDVPSSP